MTIMTNRREKKTNNKKIGKKIGKKIQLMRKNNTECKIIKYKI